MTVLSQGESEVRIDSDRSRGDLPDAIIIIYKTLEEVENKLQKNPKKNHFFTKKLIFIDKYSDLLTDLNEIFPMKRPEFKIFHSVGSNDEKTAQNGQHFYDSEKRIISKPSEKYI